MNKFLKNVSIDKINKSLKNVSINKINNSLKNASIDKINNSLKNVNVQCAIIIWIKFCVQNKFCPLIKFFANKNFYEAQ